jgi:hypothetical protein
VTPQQSDELFIDARLKKKEARKKIVKIKMTFLDRKHKINKETNIFLQGRKGEQIST